MSAIADLLRAGRPEACKPWPRSVLDRDQWRALGDAVSRAPGIDLLAMWADTQQIHALFQDRDDGAVWPVSTDVESGGYPALSPHRPAAAWFERMIHDLWGHAADGGLDARAWLDHDKWPSRAPLAPRPPPVTGPPQPPTFLLADGEDLHQIPVGPVHAGIIEPGHFRFTAQGETVARLEIRLGYLHKGTLLLLRGKSPRVAARFAARLSGDSTVAHSIAFARAAEAASGVEAPARAHALRAVMGELERLANHVGDVGAIANDAAFAFLPARLGWHREALLRAADRAFGHRLMMDCVVPGGVIADIAAGGAAAITGALDQLRAELPDLLRVYEDYASLVDRMVGTGIVTPDLARAFAAGGFVGRASGRDVDARRSPGYAPYQTLRFTVPVLREGDVDARVRIRVAEIEQSIGLLRQLLENLPEGGVSAALPPVSGEGIGWAEGFRGDVWHWLRLDSGMIAAAFPRDPSWLQWPLLEAAIHGNIVADFPLCNKSFNCSYSGVDL
jgi:Ni,Fe-hydrogenase III large subunit